MTWSEFRLKVDTWLYENNIEDPEIDSIEIDSNIDFEGFDIFHDEYGLTIFN